MRFVVCGVGGWDLRCFHLVGRDACVRTSELRFWPFGFLEMEQFFSVMSLHVYWFSDVHNCVALIMISEPT